VETDSWVAHANQVAFQADRAASNALQLAGWLVLRFTWADLTRRSRKVAATVSQALTR
jgi:very-short-patch-repair endonuclease